MDTDQYHLPMALSGDPLRNRALKSAALMVASVGVFTRLRGHGGHVAGHWPFLLLMACPLMHLFHGHCGHGHHHGQGSEADRSASREN